MEDNSVYLNIAASYSLDEIYNSSDEEPLSRKRHALTCPDDFCDSDDEPLSKLCMRLDATATNITKEPNYFSFVRPSLDDSCIEIERSPIIQNQIESNLLNRALGTSNIEYNDYEQNVLDHQFRLDNLLTANGLQRKSTDKDGNCFFTSVATFLCIDASLLRQTLCDFMDKNHAVYTPFLASEADEDEDDRFLRYFVLIHELRKEGIWCSEVADLLPRVLADWKKTEVRIFTSNHAKPFIQIVPTNDHGESIERNSYAGIISLAFLDCQPPHYDAAIHFDQTIDREPTTTFQNNILEPNDVNTCQTMSISDTVTSPEELEPFNSPIQPIRVRKRQSNPSTWKNNVRQQNHIHGKEYINKAGMTVPAKKLIVVDCTQCKFNCGRIEEEQRTNIFESFYSLNTYERQKDFVCSNVKEKNTLQMPTSDSDAADNSAKTRSKARAFYFTLNGIDERVCKKFFLATIAVGESYVHHALKNSANGTFMGHNKSGKTPHNKTSAHSHQIVKDHIESFPVVESHYTRKDTHRLYLASNLNLNKLYELYKEHCLKTGEDTVSKKTYRSIFNGNYNFSFHTPKKDQCAICVGFSMRANSGLETDADRKEHSDHLDRKENARKEKEKDKQEAKLDATKHVCTLDLQAVLQAPCGLVGPLYYKRKLCIYNFTLYDLASGRGTCYIWDETEGKRGSCEIATCVYLYLSSLPNTVKEVNFYSDCCGGQNRNQYLATALLHAVNFIPNINTITHKYLETGHTQMECDSMHSAIAFAQKNTPIFTTRGWEIVLRMARRHNPYFVVPLKHPDIMDFKKIASSIMRNTKMDINGHKVSWLKIKVLCVQKGQDDVLHLKYDFSDNWTSLKVMGSSKRGRPSLPSMSDMPKCYSSRLPISEAKKRDLLSLCNSRPEIIPYEYHGFYTALPTSASIVIDRLAEPDVEEDECDSD